MLHFSCSKQQLFADQPHFFADRPHFHLKRPEYKRTIRPFSLHSKNSTQTLNKHQHSPQKLSQRKLCQNLLPCVFRILQSRKNYYITLLFTIIIGTIIIFHCIFITIKDLSRSLVYRSKLARRGIYLDQLSRVGTLVIGNQDRTFISYLDYLGLSHRVLLGYLTGSQTDLRETLSGLLLNPGFPQNLHR